MFWDLRLAGLGRTLGAREPHGAVRGQAVSEGHLAAPWRWWRREREVRRRAEVGGRCGDSSRTRQGPGQAKRRNGVWKEGDGRACLGCRDPREEAWGTSLGAPVEGLLLKDGEEVTMACRAGRGLKALAHLQRWPQEYQGPALGLGAEGAPVPGPVAQRKTGLRAKRRSRRVARRGHCPWVQPGPGARPGRWGSARGCRLRPTLRRVRAHFRGAPRRCWWCGCWNHFGNQGHREGAEGASVNRDPAGAPWIWSEEAGVTRGQSRQGARAGTPSAPARAPFLTPHSWVQAPWPQDTSGQGERR